MSSSRLGLSAFKLPHFSAQHLLRRPALAPPAMAVGSQQHVRGMAAGGGGRTKGKKGGKDEGDLRVRMIRYSLYHPLTPRPLRFGTMRMLRHWAIHRAWQIYKRNMRRAREGELERQYNKIKEACEELRRTDLRLFRIAVSKKGVGVPPIEMRIPTDTPPMRGWNHGWTRAV
ncbi:uncharacterized protein LAJ45_09398 [Morchella importuna]|nr:uncharacterized protein LAJ45_09398 [Morchella importuna]KAH8146452.1 hypothetical protein LAJ45_09398 [Morchella importuna]